MNRLNELQPSKQTPTPTRLIALPALIALTIVSLVGGCASVRLNGSAPDASLSRLAFAASAPQQFGQTETDASDKEQASDKYDRPVEEYSDALTLLRKNYYGTPIDARKRQQLTYEAIRGMLFSLRDQFTSFLDPDEWMQMEATTKGDFEGIGAMLSQEGPETRVVEPIETGPAEKAGIHTDDIITRVDGVPVMGKDLNDVVRLIKGKEGTKVRLGIVREKKPLEFVITRSRVEPPIVKYWMEDSQAKIGHILLKEFNEKSLDQMNHAFESLQNQGMRALVFDLRYNPGGLLETAIDVASVFVPQQNDKPDLKNVAVYIKEGNGREVGRTLRDVDSAYTHPVPLVLLVNDNSASASEIVSGAIKDYGIGTLIGTRTFGKGRVQTLFPLKDGSALRLTTALYYPPKHYDINFKRNEDGERIPGTGGVLPDIEVNQSPKWKAEDFKDKADDTQLKAALDFLRAKLNGVATAQATQPRRDRQ